MRARLRVFLTLEKERTLFEMRTARTVPQRVKQRVEIVGINARWWYNELDLAYAEIAGIEAQTRQNGHGTARFKFLFKTAA